jgi:hypothetical protein
MTGVELDTLCEEWLEKRFPSYRKYYSSYYWVIAEDYPLPFQRIMRRFELDWRGKVRATKLSLVRLDDARLALGLVRTPVPRCFEKAFSEGELAV